MMPPAPTREQWRLTWFFALGAGWSLVLILVVSYWVLGKPVWLGILDGSLGWTIYPPLSARPQAIPGNQQDAGVLLAATLCGLIFLVAWLVAVNQRRRSGSSASGRKFWLSLALLLPVCMAVGGSFYSYQVMYSQEQLLFEQYELETPQDTLGEINRAK